MTRHLLRTALFVLLLLAAVGAGLYAGLTRRGPQGEVAAGPDSPVERLQTAFIDVAQQVRPAVVNIGTERRRGERKAPGPDDPAKELFEHFFGQGPRPREFRQPSLGTGVITDKRGYILTNHHVVQGADKITVRLASKREYKGQLVGADPKTDLAVIRIQPDTELTVARLGDSDRLRVGEWAIAIGSPFGLEQTVTVGVISATGRADMGISAYENFIQTDASINPGNSGGPLLNLKGEVIGINTAIVATGSGIGFAIPVNMVKRVMSQLVEKGKVVRGWLGVQVQPLTPELAQSLGAKETAGAVVASIYAGSPAERTGLQQGDLIVAFDGTKVEDYQHLQRLAAEAEVGKTVTLKILRKQSPLEVKLQITETPAEGTRKSR